MVGDTSVTTLACMRALRHCLGIWPYAPQVRHAPANVFGALQITVFFPRTPHRLHFYTLSIDAPGGRGDSG